MKKILILTILILSAFQAIPQNYSNSILALYKSSEGQKEKENEIFYYLSQPLKEMGLSVTYWDIDRGIPGQKLINRTRAVITWFRGPAMDNPGAYLDFLDKTIDSGRKVVVFDNLGAYQNRKTGKYLGPGRLNLTLSRLGIMYFGDWTDDPDLIRIDYKNSSIVEHGGHQDTSVSRLYYRYVQHDRNLKVYLALNRSDRDYDASPVIMTNKNGGFAFSRYIYRIEEGKVRMLLNIKAFLEHALFPDPAGERIVLLADTSDPSASGILDYAKGVLRRVKIPFEVITKEKLIDLIPGDLRCFTSVGLILRHDAGLKPAVLKDFLEHGGGLVNLLGGKFKHLAPHMGLKSPQPAGKVQKGYKIRYGFILGEGLSLEGKSDEWAPGANSPCSDAEILAYNYKGDVPLLWTVKKEKGRVLIWNWDGFETGDYQGLLLESFMYVRPVGISATAGIGLIFIDDWPLPMYNVVKAPLKTTDTEYYTQTWWPDIKELFKKRNIPFASYLIFNYNSITTPPFTGGEFFVAKDLATVKIAREILDSGEELAFHGYNHMSLTEKATGVNLKRWSSKTAMKQSLEAARNEWISLFGEHSLPFAYVAPNNIISEMGMEALKEVFPSIKVVSTLRSGMDDETVTEFEPHPGIKDLYFIPRTSCGYPFTNQTRKMVTAAVTGAGVLAHFIHPDDVFDKNRSSGMSWEELKRDLGRTLDYVDRHYPWLRFVSIREAYHILKKADESRAEFKWEKNTLTINSTPGLLLRIRLNDKKIKGSNGLKIIYKYKRMEAVIAETTQPCAQMTFYD